MSTSRPTPLDPKPRKRNRTDSPPPSPPSTEDSTSQLTPPPQPPPPKAEGRIRGVLAKSPLSLTQPQDPEAGQTDLKYLLAIGATNGMECPLCATVMCTRTSLKRHLSSHLKGAKVHCQLCDARFQTEAALSYHKSSAHAGK